MKKRLEICYVAQKKNGLKILTISRVLCYNVYGKTMKRRYCYVKIQTFIFLQSAQDGFCCSDGSMMAVTYSKDIHYLDSNGKYQIETHWFLPALDIY